jgi:S1-C subfamily serine protease
MKRYISGIFIGAGILISLAACRFSSGLTATPPVFPTMTAPQTPAVILIPDRVALQDSLVALYDKVSPGEVSIRVLTDQGEALGSGFVIDTDGHILTNYHVVEGETDLEIDFPSGIKVRGKVVGTDLDSDIAVINVDVRSDELHPLTLGDSDQVKVGQSVVAIGNPFGLSGSMTVGIVSALGRTLSSLHTAPGGNYYTAGDMIQTDTAINPGNSGGPLLNLNGEVIGINRAIRSENFSSTGETLNSGIGFAISINPIKRVLPSIIQSGNYDYPYLGISSLDEITLLIQEALDLPQATGAYVSEVTPGGPADKAGLRGGTNPTYLPNVNAGGDLIIAIDGHEVKSFGDMLRFLLNNKSPGDTVRLTIIRENKEMEVNLILGKRP